MKELLRTHTLNKKKGQQSAKMERGTIKKEKPLSIGLSEQGGNKQALLKSFQDFGDYISIMILSEYTELMYSSDFHDLSTQQREIECMKLFSTVMTRYIDEFEK